MTIEARIRELGNRHRTLDETIQKEMTRPSVDTLQVRELKQRKLREASKLLVTSQMTVEEIMSEVGYDNSSFFYHAFSGQYGMSPAEYRKRNR